MGILMCDLRAIKTHKTLQKKLAHKMFNFGHSKHHNCRIINAMQDIH